MRFTKSAVAAVLVAGLGGLAAVAQPPGGGRGMFGGGGPTQLINSKTVQQELKIDEDRPASSRSGPGVRGQVPGEDAGGVQGHSPGAIPEKFAEIQAKMSEEAYKEIGTVLKEDQVKRLKQIEVQVPGARAFTMSHVQEALKLTDEQKEKVRQLQEESGKEMQEWPRSSGSVGGRRASGPTRRRWRSSRRRRRPSTRRR